MNKAEENFKVLFSWIISIIILCLGFWFIWYVFGLFNSVQPPVQAAIITAFVGFTSLIISNFYTREREINLKLREKKVEVYSKFIKSWIQTLLNIGLKSNQNSSDSKDVNPDDHLQEFTKTLKEITDDLILWGSDEIIKDYCDLRKKLPNENSTEIAKTSGIISFGKFMLSIRKDLGHSNTGIDEYDLMSLFITDSDKLRALKPEIDKFLKSIK